MSTQHLQRVWPRWGTGSRSQELVSRLPPRVARGLGQELRSVPGGSAAHSSDPGGARLLPSTFCELPGLRLLPARSATNSSRAPGSPLPSGYKTDTLCDASTFRGPGRSQRQVCAPAGGGVRTDAEAALTCRLSPSRFSESQCCCRRLRHSVLSAESRSTISLSRTRI